MKNRLTAVLFCVTYIFVGGAVVQATSIGKFSVGYAVMAWAIITYFFWMCCDQIYDRAAAEHNKKKLGDMNIMPIGAAGEKPNMKRIRSIEPEKQQLACSKILEEVSALPPSSFHGLCVVVATDSHTDIRMAGPISFAMRARKLVDEAIEMQQQADNPAQTDVPDAPKQNKPTHH